MSQAAKGLDVHENVLREWVKAFGYDPDQAFPGYGHMKPEHFGDRAAQARAGWRLRQLHRSRDPLVKPVSSPDQEVSALGTPEAFA